MRTLGKTLLMVLALATSVWAQSNVSITSGPSFTAIPITQLSTSTLGASAPSGTTYKGFEGGLYERGSNQVPSDHDAIGRSVAEQIQPIHGKIVVMAVSMSNGGNEWSRFMVTYGNNPAINSAVKLVNGRQVIPGLCYYAVPFGDGGKTLCRGNSPNPYDLILSGDLTPQGLSDSDVQVIWLKHTDTIPTQAGMRIPASLPALDSTSYAYNYEKNLAGALRGMHQRYPNLKLVFMSTRIYGGYCSLLGPCKSPEPYAYENGFIAKWVIQAQINQADRGGSADPIAGVLTYRNSPWVAWGPYLWADGNIPRSDGLAWCLGQSGSPCFGQSDFTSDDLHPNVNGQDKVAGMLMNFFLTSPYTTWFKAKP